MKTGEHHYLGARKWLLVISDEHFIQTGSKGVWNQMPGVGGGGQLEMMAASTGGLFQGQSDTALFISNIWVHKAIETETGISSMTIPYEILKSNPIFFFAQYLDFRIQPSTQKCLLSILEYELENLCLPM